MDERAETMRAGDAEIDQPDELDARAEAARTKLADAIGALEAKRRRAIEVGAKALRVTEIVAIAAAITAAVALAAPVVRSASARWRRRRALRRIVEWVTRA